MQQRSLKALWFPLLFQNWVKLTLCLCSQVLKYYCDNVLAQGLLPDIRRSSNDNFLFSRMERRHTVHATLSLTCAPICPNSLNQKLAAKQSRSKFCGLFSVGALQQMVYSHKISDIDQLKLLLIDCWAQLSQDMLNRAIDQLSKRLMTVIKVKGAHVEFRLD